MATKIGAQQWDYDTVRKRIRQPEKITQEVRKNNILFNEPVYTGDLKVVDVVREIAKEIEATPAQVVLKWTMEREVVATVLVRKLKHLKNRACPKVV